MIRTLLVALILTTGCTTTRDGIETIDAGDGTSFSHEFRNGVPRGGENDHAQTFVGLASADGKANWSFQLKFKGGFETNVKSISVYDATAKPVLLVADKKPVIGPEKMWSGLKPTDASWMLQDDDSFFIFKFVVIGKDGKKEVIYQPQNFTRQNKKMNRALIEAMAARSK